MIDKKSNYNNIPVKYCKVCLDLKILSITHNNKEEEYCGKCGSTDIDTSHINNFNLKHIDLYGEDYITRNK